MNKYVKQKQKRNFASMLSQIVIKQIQIPLDNSFALARDIIKELEMSIRLRKQMLKMTATLRMANLIASSV